MADKKSQSMSMDIMIGVVVFLASFLVIFAMLNSSKGKTAEELKQKASQVIKEAGASDPTIRLTDNNEINETKMNRLKNMSYDALKKKFGIEEDICIYIEDERGNIIILNNSYKGIGAPNINLSGTPCSQK
ncbi:hypothetical protein HYS31_06695 [Candidatus Woesearchaeota archaeon]|nr:hypothetical protein [Candidatus Woesearchaeota archaeon]